jgi:hypothetical protein
VSYFDVGNNTINSTYAPVTGPDTTTLIAELDSTLLGTATFRTGQQQNVRVSWIVGADTNATWQLETCTSTALNSGVDIFYPKTVPSQSGQYVTAHRIGQNYRIRARLFSTAVNASAYISAEPLT